MKAIYLNQRGGAESLVYGDLPQPQTKTDEVLIKVHATAITPTEFQWYPTFQTQAGETRPFPIVLSHEFSGEAAALGTDVKDLKVGDAVYGLNDWFANGAQAEYCIAPASALAHKPRLLDHVQSAVVPISALTAWQGLLCRANVQSSQRVLIHGAAGGVGIFAVQLARWRGAHVIATASAANLDFVRRLGAHEVINYRATRFEDVVRDVDAVFDTVGGETLARSWNVLKPGGKLVTVAAGGSHDAEKRVREAFMLVRADPCHLKQIAGLIDAGELRVSVEAVYPLARARNACVRAQQGKMRGKIVLQITE
jgi:NADPH:quinone reductase-like Zn-dependent oxidoreductase